MAIRFSRLIRTGPSLLRIKEQARELSADPVVTYTTFGTGPALNYMRGSEGHFVMSVTSGTGTPVAADNNVIITFAQNPTAVFLKRGALGTVKWFASVSGATVRLGMGVAIAASTEEVFELIVEF